MNIFEMDVRILVLASRPNEAIDIINSALSARDKILSTRIDVRERYETFDGRGLPSFRISKDLAPAIDATYHIPTVAGTTIISKIIDVTPCNDADFVNVYFKILSINIDKEVVDGITEP
jgi:hypothetical protein